MRAANATHNNAVPTIFRHVAFICVFIAFIVLFRNCCCVCCRLTGIRRPKRRVCPCGHGQVFVAYPPAQLAFYQMMTPKSSPAKAAFVLANPKAKLLDQLREVLRVKHYSLRTEEAYVLWARRFLKFHRDRSGAWKHPRELGATEVGLFLNHLANVEHVAAATQNQALNAIVGLFVPVSCPSF